MLCAAPGYPGVKRRVRRQGSVTNASAPRDGQHLKCAAALCLTRMIIETTLQVRQKALGREEETLRLTMRATERGVSIVMGSSSTVRRAR